MGLLEGIGLLPHVARDMESIAQAKFWMNLTGDSWRPWRLFLQPALDEFTFRLWLLYPTAAFWLSPCLLPWSCVGLDLDKQPQEQLQLVPMSVSAAFVLLEVAIWQLWRCLRLRRIETSYRQYSSCLVALSAITFALVELWRNGPGKLDLMVLLCAVQKSYVLSWFSRTRGIIAAVFLHGFSNLLGETTAWLYQHMFTVAQQQVFFFVVTVITVCTLVEVPAETWRDWRQAISCVLFCS